MSNDSLRTAGILLIVFPTVVFGGASLLWHWITRNTAYYQHPLRRDLWRAGHAHAGVLLILSLVALVLVDDANLSDGWKQVVRAAFHSRRSSCRSPTSCRSSDRTQSAPTVSSTSRTSARSASSSACSHSASDSSAPRKGQACRLEAREPGQGGVHQHSAERAMSLIVRGCPNCTRDPPEEDPMTEPVTHKLEVPGAVLRYDVRESDPPAGRCW